MRRRRRISRSSRAAERGTSTCRASERPCSMPFDAIFVPDAMRAAVDDRAWLAAMLDAEAALARAQARAGVFPAAGAEEVARVGDADRYDLAQLGRDARSAGNPVPAVVRAADTEWFHHGAT